jgi:hypothetical protein
MSANWTTGILVVLYLTWLNFVVPHAEPDQDAPRDLRRIV